MKLFITIIAVAAMAMADDKALQTLLNDANNQFTAKMFSEVVKENPNKAVVLSAFSVLTPLAQLALASEGPSHDELLKTLSLPDDDTTKQVFTLVNNQLRSVKGVELKTASRVYLPNSYELNDDFAAVSKQVFNSDVKNVDFTASAETANAINSWVEDQTNHRIKDLVDANSLDENTRAVLVNAIYFKGTWKEKFDVNDTVDRDFHVTKDKTLKVPTMSKTAHFKYGESAELDAKLLELPYVGDESSLLVVLPNLVDGLSALEEKLKDPSALAKATEKMHEAEVSVFLPKFKIETRTDLKKVLQNLNVKKLFNGNEAQLNKLLKSSEPLFVSDAVQKAFIEVNEEGAEAAAANVILVLTRARFYLPSAEFVADRPFVFIIRTKQLNIFIGRYSE